MDLLTREVLNQTIAEAIDATRNKICAEDEIFQQDEKDLDELTKRVMDLDLPEHDRMIINALYSLGFIIPLFGTKV